MNWPEKYSLPLFYNMLARKMLPGFRACRSILGPVAFLGWLFISGFPAVSGAFHGHDAAASVTSNLKSSLVQANEQFVVAKKMIEESVNHGNGGKDEHLPVGLRNLRNTCYMNAVLQCLFSVRQFSLAITMKAYKFKRDSIGEEVQDLFLKMDTPSKSGYRIPIRPQTLAEKLEINVDEQEDASELMLKILNELDESVVNKKPKKSKRGKNNQPVSSSSPECHNSMEEKSGLSSAVTTSDDMSSQASESIQTCHQMTPLPSSTTVAEELDLPPTSALKMEIHQSIRCIDHDHVSSQKVDEHLDLSVNIKGCRTIEDAIREYFTPELLNGENQYKCEKHGLQDAEKSLKIKKLPRVLAVHLKRFSFDPETYQMKKVVDLVDVAETLDLAPYSMKEALSHDPTAGKYNLQAAIIHEGTLGYGHYYAYAKVPINHEQRNADRQHWVKLNDDKISAVSFDEVLDVARGKIGVIPTQAIGPRPRFGSSSFSTNAYILFYTQQD